MNRWMVLHCPWKVGKSREGNIDRYAADVEEGINNEWKTAGIKEEENGMYRKERPPSYRHPTLLQPPTRDTSPLHAPHDMKTNRSIQEPHKLPHARL